MFVSKRRTEVNSYLVYLVVLVILILHTQAEPDRMTRKARGLQILGSYQVVNIHGLSSGKLMLNLSLTGLVVGIDSFDS